VPGRYRIVGEEPAQLFASLGILALRRQQVGVYSSRLVSCGLEKNWTMARSDSSEPFTTKVYASGLSPGEPIGPNDLSDCGGLSIM
jgi:hypothetical protein